MCVRSVSRVNQGGAEPNYEYLPTPSTDSDSRCFVVNWLGRLHNRIKEVRQRLVQLFGAGDLVEGGAVSKGERDSCSVPLDFGLMLAIELPERLFCQSLAGKVLVGLGSFLAQLLDVFLGGRVPTVVVNADWVRVI